MTLTLQAVSLNEQPLTQPITTHFDARGGTIGRADHATMALPDPERHISRLQAEIVALGSGYLIRNVGTTNPIVVAGRVLARGESAPLAHGDAVRIGGYQLMVELRDTSDDTLGDHNVRTRMAPVTPPPPMWSAPAAAPPMSSDNPFADLLDPRASRGDGLADLFAPASPPPPPAVPELIPPMAGIHPQSAAVAVPPAVRLPADFDPFAPPAAGPQPAPTPTPQGFADIISDGGTVSLDKMFDLGQADLLSRFTAEAAPAPAVAPPQADDVRAVHAAFVPPRPVVPPPGLAPSQPPPAAQPTLLAPLPTLLAPLPTISAPPATIPAPLPTVPAPLAAMPAPPPRRPTPAGPDDAAALWAAFCEGAGIDLPLPPGDGPERMRKLGHILHSAIAGTLQLMAVRASTKHEMRAAVTVIQQRSNNPLKFSPDAKAGIEQLLQPPARGFLDGPDAIDDAMHDLVGHSIGTVAGMRAALDGMLDRFDPALIESQRVGHTMLEGLLPMQRKARLWEQYLHHYGGLREQAQEDFHNLFGKAFLAAYEQQVERLGRDAAAR